MADVKRVIFRFLAAGYRLLLLLFIALSVRIVQAQSPFLSAPLSAPVLAATNAARDGIQLYSISDGTTRTLRFGTGEHTVWDFSPDGCRILYTLRSGHGPARLYSARLDGSDIRSLVNYGDLPADKWGVWEPQWSPDGSKIAFTMMRDSPQLDKSNVQGDDPRDYRIAWVPIGGGSPTFYTVSGDEHSPRWSPDGNWLAYIAYERRVPGATTSATAEPTKEPPPGATPQLLPTVREADLWVVGADAEKKYRLTYFATGTMSDPRWSPDGTLIGLVYSPTAGNDQFWMIANKSGAIPTQLSAAPVLALDLTWLPDSSAMLASARDMHNTSENRLWRIPLVGSADTDAVEYDADPALSAQDFPRFSADGQWLALRSAFNLAIMKVADQTWTLLDEGNIGSTPPVWSPAGFKGEDQCS
jgi:Tol biopolymer transport system component